MEFVLNETSGLYWVELGGVLYTNCTKDVDCPGRAVCLSTASWAQYPNMCVCDLFMGFTGAECTEMSPCGWFFYIGNIFASFFASVWCVVGLVDLLRLIRWKRFHRDAVSTSLVFAFLGLFFTAVETGKSTRYATSILPPDASGSKTDPVATNTITLSLSYLFSTLAMLNVSVVWIEVSENADMMRKSSSSNISRYKRALAVYYVFFFGFIAISLSFGNELVAAAFAVPGVIFIIISYVLGAWKMRNLLKLYLSSNGAVTDDGSVPPTSSKDAVRKIRESLRLIETAALCVSFNAFMFVIWMGLWFVLEEVDDQPDHSLHLVAVTLAWIFVAFANATVMWYLHVVIQRKAKAIVSATEKGVVVVAMNEKESGLPSPRLTSERLKVSQNHSPPTPKDETSQPHVSSSLSPKQENPSVTPTSTEPKL